jgi:hypothetical protein
MKTKPTKVYALLTEKDSYDVTSLDVRLVYLDEQTDKPRNFSSDCFRDLKASELYLADLGLLAHWYKGLRDPGEWLSHEIGYYDAYRVCAGMAKAMISTLTKIGMRMDVTNNEIGYAKDFAETVVRFGAAVGVAGYLVCKGRNSSSYDDNEYHTLSAQGIISHIRALAEARNTTVSVG